MLAAAYNGENKAFMGMVSPLIPNLRRLASRFSRSSADADDICQDSLLKAYRKLDQFSGTDELATHEFQSWLMTIAHNSAIDFLRRKHTNRFVPLEECASAAAMPHQPGSAGWGENPERAYVRRERLALIAQAITKLPTDLRRVCLLRNVLELSTKEVAAQLGITPTAVRLRLFRAHSHLRKSLAAVEPARTRARRNFARCAESTDDPQIA